LEFAAKKLTFIRIIQKTMRATALIIAIAILIISSCSKDPKTGPAGPQGPAGPSGATANGSISGKVKYYNQYGDTIQAPSNSSITVTVKTQVATVASNGSYMVNNVPPGVHTVRWGGAGFPEFQLQELVHPGNDNMTLNLKLYQTPTYTLSNALINNTSIVQITGNISDVANRRGVLMIVSRNPNLDAGDPSTYIDAQVLIVNPGAGSFAIQYTAQFSGTMYFRIYPYNGAFFISSYWDVATEKSVFPARGNPYVPVLSAFR
jgi:hypothetical protein